MIDLHCHMLPGIDDGAPDLDVSLEMARMAVEDGIRVTACTPHILPGYYDNSGPGILDAVSALQPRLAEAGIDLQLVAGADVHLTPSMASGLKAGRLLVLAGSRYFLLEPPHGVAPPRLAETVFDIMSAGYHPLVTHPERLTWIESHYEVMVALARAGAWMQITAGSVTGRFGKRPQYWAERMLDEGLVHVLATDAHDTGRRAPILSRARQAVADRLGEAAAHDMTVTRPQGVLDDTPPARLPPAVGLPTPAKPNRGLLRSLFKVG